MSRSTQIGCAAWRISRLDPDGTPDYDNANGAFAVCGGITQLTVGFETEEGDSIFVKDSIGAPCVNVTRDDIDKWVTFEVTLCKDDYRIYEILGLGDAIDDGGDIIGVGFTMAEGCAVTSRARVCLELWAEQYDCDALVEDFPYKRHVFTKCVLAPQGYDISSDPSLPVFSGKAFNNANFDDGPFGDLDDLVSANWAGAYVVIDDDTLPVCPEPLDYIAIPPAAS